MLSEIRVALFAKWPEKGKVKTRLASTLGEAFALQMYQWLFARQVEQLLQSQLVWDLWMAPASRCPDATLWQPNAHAIFPQAEGDLGQRLESATQQTFQAGAAGILLIGADCPYLSAHILVKLAQAISEGRFVLAPTEDGGYAAFGLPSKACQFLGPNAFAPGVFQAMPWSTPALLDATLEVLKRTGHQPELSAPLLDCDTEADWRRIRKDFPNCPDLGMANPI